MLNKVDKHLEKIILVLGALLGVSFAITSVIDNVLPVLIAGVFFVVPFFFILLKNTDLGVLIITFLLPFEQIGGIDIAGMNVRLSQVVFILTFGAWILKGLYQKNLKIKIDLKLVLILIFCIICILSFNNTINLFRSVQIFAFIVFTFLVYFFVSSYKFTDELIFRLIKTLLVSMFITCIFGLYQFAGDMVGIPPKFTGLEENYVKAVFGFPRIQSTANEPLNFANYLILPLSIAFSFFAAKTIKLKSKVGEFYNYIKSRSLMTLILGGVVMVLTFSRGGWGGLALSFVMLALVHFKYLLSPKNIMLGIVSAVLLIGGIFAFIKITDAPFTLDVLLERINVSDFSAKHRVMTLQDGLEGWSHHKLIGIGLGAYGPYVAKYQNIEPEGGWQTVNNEYGELLIEIGILGLSTICLFWIVLVIDGLVRAKRLQGYKRYIQVAMIAAFVGMLLQYISFSTLYVFHLWFLAGLINNNYFHRSK